MWFSWVSWVVIGLGFWIAAWVVGRGAFRRKRVMVSMCVFGLSGIGFAAVAVGVYLGWWFVGRSGAERRNVFEGVEYLRVVGDGGVRFVAHMVFVDLRQTDLSFVVTPAESDVQPRLRASTVGEFLEKEKAQVAINANFFDPFYSK